MKHAAYFPFPFPFPFPSALTESKATEAMFKIQVFTL